MEPKSPVNREKEIFEQALDLESTRERLAFLKGACGADASMLERLHGLLRASEGASAFLPEAPHAAGTVKLDIPDPRDEAVGQRLGRYKLLERIGEGGCGVVYVAEQTEPVRRRVALKVVKLGMDTKQVVARFEAERQALATMDHPNIAKVLDAGTTDVGRPYFVMELVRGIRITDYCDQAQLSTKDRLDLFIKVCHAIQHAHQKGIIHRDIKPSNILVTLHDGVPVPKVIDFGIAKATEGRLTDATVYTQLHQFMGTPAYMSPEQAEMSGLDIDTRSDIYSLGVLLYELLAGSTPFNGKELLASGIDAMRKTIREKEPVRPSTRLATLKGAELTTTAKRRSAEAPKLIHLLKGDLDWIVMKCLEKDRQRRYDTANGVAADLRRHLNNELVVARPPTVSYRLRKFAGRNKLAVTAGSLVLLAVILGLVASTWSLLLERKARHRAERAEQQQATLRESAEKALKEADEQRAAAQAAEKVTAKHVRRLAEDNYAQRIDVATVALHRNDLFRARKELDSCDPQLRGWEWSFVNFSTRLLTTVPGADKPLFTPDGRHLIVCGDGPTDRKLMIMDASTGETVSAIPVGRSVRSPAISVDGTRLACAYGNGVIALWDLVTQKQLWSNQIHTANCDGIVFSSDGTKLASAGHDGFLKLLRTADGLVLREWPLPGIRFRNVALSPDGKRITAGVLNTDANSSIQVGAIIWDTQTGAELFRLKGCTSIVETLAFSADGEWLVTGERDGTVQQWNANNGEFVRTITRHGERGHVERIQSVAISPDGRLLSSSAPDGIQVREFKTGRLIHTLPRSPDRTSIPWLTFSPDGSKLTAFNHTSGKPGDMAVFDISERGRTRVLTHGQKAWSVAFSPDGRRVVSGGMGQPARVWDVTTGEMLRALPVIDGRFVGFTPDGLRVLSGGSRGEAALWDVAEGKSVRNFNGSQFYLHSSALSSDGTRIATAGQDKVLRIWDATTGRLLNELRGHNTNSYSIYTVAFSPDGSKVATGGGDDTLRLWNVAAGQLIHTSECEGSVTGVAFTPDGTRVAGAGTWKSVKLWDVATGQPLLTLGEVHAGTVWAVTFSPDGRRIVSGDETGTLLISNSDNGRTLLTIDSEQKGIWGLAWSPDGNTIASAGEDGTIHLWETQAPGQQGTAGISHEPEQRRTPVPTGADEARQ